MNHNTHLLKSYDLLVDTLIMTCPDFASTSEDDLKNVLSELEGDSYTFFDYRNLIKLGEAGLLNDLQIEKIVLLKKKIIHIPGTLWNAPSFRSDPLWNEIKKLADDVLNSLHIDKRKLG